MCGLKVCKKRNILRYENGQHYAYDIFVRSTLHFDKNTTEVFFQKSNLQLISIASGNEQATTDYLNQIPPNSLNACVRVRQRA